MIDLDFDCKHGSMAGQACDVILWLVALQFLHQNWNYYNAFLNYLEKNDAEKYYLHTKTNVLGVCRGHVLSSSTSENI